MRRVVRLTEADLARDSRRLVEQVAASGFAPTGVVAIARAGVFVADAMARSGLPDVPMYVVRCQRPSAAIKRSGRVSALVRALPDTAQRALRIVEHELVTRRLPSRREVTMAADTQERLVTHPGQRLLIVDDAVDTGASLAAVKAHLKALDVEHQLRVAALTRSFAKRSPPVEFCVYEDILIQGPWSLDRG